MACDKNQTYLQVLFSLQTVLHRKSSVFSGYFAFLRQGILRRWIGISPWLVTSASRAVLCDQTWLIKQSCRLESCMRLGLESKWDFVTIRLTTCDLNSNKMTWTCKKWLVINASQTYRRKCQVKINFSTTCTRNSVMDMQRLLQLDLHSLTYNCRGWLPGLRFQPLGEPRDSLIHGKATVQNDLWLDLKNSLIIHEENTKKNQ
jgi:hypothetical protein